MPPNAPREPRPEPGARPARPILVILHQEHSTPGRVGLRLQARGHALDIRRPRFGDPLPESLAEHDGAVIFGGPMSANDSDDYLKQETDWLAVPLKEGVPFLGLCLGAQLLARHLGAKVGPHADGMVEIGYYRLLATAAGRSLLDWPDLVHHFHNEGFDLPEGATLLAEGETFANQAFSYGRAAFGIQFHIELTTAMVNRWTHRIGERSKLPNAQSREHHFRGRALHDWKTTAFLEHFLDMWLKQPR
ncbi:MAG: glutamine amidotransferase [Bauldia sp.]